MITNNDYDFIPIVPVTKVDFTSSTSVHNAEENIAIDIKRHDVCNHCDNASDIPHGIIVTRIRVANLCCSGEERIIRSSLEGMNGVENVMVNIVGRYAVVKHCPVACCSPAEAIVDALNDKRLGASIQEANADNDDELDEPFNWVSLVHVLIVFMSFLVGVIAMDKVENHDVSMVIFLISIGLGLIPILKSAYVSINRRTVDINILIAIAVAGAIAIEEYFDASLVLALFLMAEEIEQYVMRRVRIAVKVSMGRVSKTATLVSGIIMISP